MMTRLLSWLLLSGCALLAVVGSCPGQTPIFSEVLPFYEPGAGTFTRFPALRDMRSAWGDFDADGDLDVAVMGRGASGPVTKVYLNDPSSAAIPFAFGEARINPALPQLQDGALAWGDMDNDGLLDLAMIGSITDTPSSPADLRFHVLRNNGANASGAWTFTESLSSPFFTRGRLGCVSWRDVDNDGDADLFVSGLAWNAGTNQADLKFSRLYISDGTNLSPGDSVVLRAEGSAATLTLGDPLPADGLHIRRVTWTDMDRDGFADMILSGAVAAAADSAFYQQEVWLNWQRRDWGRGDAGDDAALAALEDRIEDSLFARLGLPVEGILFYGTNSSGRVTAWNSPSFTMSINELLGSSGETGGAGDWDGDGRMDLMVPTYIYDDLHPEESLNTAKVLRQDPLPLPVDLIPGFKALKEIGAPDEERFGCSAWTAADVLNHGRPQWLATVFDPNTSEVVGAPQFSVLSHHVPLPQEPERGLSKDASNFGITGRWRGALDAVDVNNDGRLEILLSGYDETMALGTAFYRQQASSPIPANTAPTAPYGLKAEATPFAVRFAWNAGQDAETETKALQYAVQLRRSDGRYFLRPGATLSGRRLYPGIEGTFPFTGEGYDLNLRLMSVANVSALPRDGRSLMVVALVGGQLHVRVFDERGNRVVDRGENSLTAGGELLSLKALLNRVPLPDAAALTPAQRQTHMASAASIANYTMLGYVFNPHNAGYGKPLPDGTYWWSVQAVDSAGAGSPFASEQSFTLGSAPATNEQQADIPWRDAAVDLSDVDGDGDLDVGLAGHAESGTAGGTAVRRNDGEHPTDPETQVFSGGASSLPPLEQGAMKWADVDGDGDIDVAVSGRSLGQPMTRVYRNDAGAFTLRNVLEGVDHSALDWGDYDNDGDLDLVVTGYRDGVPRTRLYRNGGDLNQSPGQLVAVPVTLPDFGNGAAAWGDYDHDGDLDLLLCGDTQSYTGPAVPCNAPPANLRPPGASLLCAGTGQPAMPKTTLFRNDGLALSGGRAGQWKFTTVPAGFPDVVSYSGGRALTARAEWCDLSGDGYPDLVLGGLASVPGFAEYGAPSAKVFRNAGAGPDLGSWHFLPGTELLTGILDHALQTLTCADWNGDGRPDLLLGGWLNGPGTVPLQLIHNDSMNFTRRTYLHTTDALGAQQFAGGLAAFGHFDGDANVDVAFSGRWGIQGVGAPGNHGTAGRLFLNSPGAGNSRPTAPTALNAVVSGGGTEVTLSWNRSFDNGLQPVYPSYNLHVERVDGQPGGMPGMADLTTGKRRVSRTGNVAHHLSWTLRNLPVGEYRWAVQAIDAALATSAFATAAQTFMVAPPVAPVITPQAPLHQWVVVHPMVSAVDFPGIAAGRNARLAVARRGQILLSLREETFFPVESGVFTDLHDVVIDSEGAIVVGEAGVIRTSSDGIVWTESPSGTTATLRAIARGNTNWIAAGDGVLLHSTDRRAWTPITLAAGTAIHDVTWAQGRYVAVGGRANAKVLLTSTDGLTWTDVTPAGLIAGKFTGVAGHDTMFIAVGGSDTIGGGLTFHSDVLSSPTGLTWTSTMSTTEETMQRIIYNEQSWFAVRDREVRRSLDGSTWTTVFGDSFARTRAVAADAGLITMAGTKGLIFDAPLAGLTGTSNWTRRSGASPAQTNYFDFSHIAARGATAVAVGSGGMSFHSLDGGLTWTRDPDGDFNGFYGLAEGAGRFVRTFQSEIQSSADGVIWERHHVPGTRAVTFGNARFVAARVAGGFMVSADGRSWNQVSPAIPRCEALAFGNGRFLAREAFNGNVFTSLDGSTWTSTAPVGGFGPFSFARDRFFALSAGFPSVLATSPDGVAWQPLAGVPAGSFTQVVWHRDRYILIGDPTLASTDLVDWTPVPVPATAIAAASVTGRLLIAGAGQALLYSPDSALPPPPAAPTLTIHSNPAPNLFLFTLTGRAGLVVTLQRSADMQTWTAVDTFTLAGGEESLEVAAPNARSTDYFRLRWVP